MKVKREQGEGEKRGLDGGKGGETSAAVMGKRRRKREDKVSQRKTKHGKE